MTYNKLERLYNGPAFSSMAAYLVQMKYNIYQGTP
jgi:hypothetical protein